MTGGGSSGRGFRRPRADEAPKGYSEDAVLSEDEVERRVDLRAAAGFEPPTSPWIGEAAEEPPAIEPPAPATEPAAPPIAPARAGSEPEPAPVPANRMARVEPAGPARTSRTAQDDRRRQLWRDSATILIGVVLALIVGQTLAPAQTARPDGSPSALPSTIAIGSVGPPVTIPPAPTFGPIVNPSLGIDASPTPIPVITMGPTPSPTPTPAPTVRPSSSIKPTPKATVKPTPRPTRTPSPPPTPSPPLAGFDQSASSVNAGGSVDFTDTSTGEIDSWSWTFGDGGTSTMQSPSHTFLAPCPPDGVCTVRLTVTGPGGSDFIEHPVTVNAP